MGMIRLGEKHPWGTNPESRYYPEMVWLYRSLIHMPYLAFILLHFNIQGGSDISGPISKLH